MVTLFYSLYSRSGLNLCTFNSHPQKGMFKNVSKYAVRHSMPADYDSVAHLGVPHCHNLSSSPPFCLPFLNKISQMIMVLAMKFYF